MMKRSINCNKKIICWDGIVIFAFSLLFKELGIYSEYLINILLLAVIIFKKTKINSDLAYFST